jgi:hypothetical protein
MSLNTHDHRSTTRPEVAARRHGGPGPAIALDRALTALVAGAALAGLLVDGVYAGAESTAEMLRGYDLVTALVVVPALVIATHLARRGSVMAHLVVASLVGYVVYTDAYYLFGTGFNDLFLLHAAVFSTGLVALGLTLASLDLDALAARFDPRTRRRTIAGILGVLAAALGGMWVYVAVDTALTGEAPTGSKLVETDTVVHLAMALDLTLLVPLYAAAAWLLWWRAPWGYALAGLALFAGLLHQLGYMVAMPFQAVADVPGAVAHDPGEPLIVLMYLTASALLLDGCHATGRMRRMLVQPVQPWRSSRRRIRRAPGTVSRKTASSRAARSSGSAPVSQSSTGTASNSAARRSATSSSRGSSASHRVTSIRSR